MTTRTVAFMMSLIAYLWASIGGLMSVLGTNDTLSWCLFLTYLVIISVIEIAAVTFILED